MIKAKLYISVILAACLLAACTQSDDLMVAGSDDVRDRITISFQMLTSASVAGSRADAFHPETGSEYLRFEDGIDSGDLGLFLFARTAGDTSAPEKLVMKITDFRSSYSSDSLIYIYGVPGAYTVTMDIKKDKLDSVLNHSITPNSTGQVVFRILLLANCTPSSAGRQAKWDAIDGLTYADVIDQLGKWNFAMSAIYDSAGADDAPSIYSGNIPMFGTRIFTVSEEALYFSRPGNRIYLGDIDMLRALAKVRLVDNISDRDVDGYPMIIDAEIVGSQDMACQLPYDAPAYVNGTQVHTPRLAQPDKMLTLTDAPVYRLGTIPAAWVDTSIQPGRPSGSVRIGYIPEQAIGYADNNVANGLPMFRITVALDKDNNKVYEIPMTGYDGTTFNFGNNSILRNHIYTVSVNKLEYNAELTVNVVPWNSVSYSFEYTDHVGLTDDGALKFETGTYMSLDKQRGRLVLNYPGAAVGSFGIATPAGSTWDAYLVTTTGEQDAIRFRLPDGSLSTHISGLVGTTTRFEVVAANAPGQSPCNSLLQVIITMPDGRSMPVNVLTGGGYDSSVKNMIFIQNPQ